MKNEDGKKGKLRWKIFFVIEIESQDCLQLPDVQILLTDRPTYDNPPDSFSTEIFETIKITGVNEIFRDNLIYIF